MINILVFGFLFVIILPPNASALIANLFSRNSILSLSFQYSNSSGNAQFYVNVSGSPCYLSNYLIINNTNFNLKEIGTSVNNSENNCSILNFTSGSVNITNQVSLTFNICCVTQGSKYLISLTFGTGFNDSANITAHVRNSAVRNLTASSNWGVNNLFIQWDRLSNVNGTILGYLVVIGRQTSGNICVKRWRLNCSDCGDSQNMIDPILRNCSETNGPSFNTSDDRTITLSSNDSSIGIASKYVVIVSALNGFGWGEESNISIVTGEYTSGPVSNLSINSSFPSSPLMVTWSPPENPNGEIVQYLVWVQNPNNNSQCVLKLIMNCTNCTNNINNSSLSDNNIIACNRISGSTFSSNSTISITINDSVIIACSDYLINVMPLNGYGWGNSMNKSIKTGVYLLDSVSHLNCTNSSYHSIWCTWSLPIIKNSVILNYRISYLYDSTNTTYIVSNTTQSINITNNIIPDVQYNIEITPINMCGLGNTTNFYITIYPAINPEVINASQIANLMNSYTLVVKDDRYELSIVLPFKHFTDNRGKIIKFTVVVNKIINENENRITERGSITPPSYSDKTYAYCNNNSPCVYEIDVTNKRNSKRQKRATDSEGNVEFTIGNAKTSNDPNDYTNNGQLQANTKYMIAFRAYTRAGFISVGFITNSTKIDIKLVAGLTITFILLLAGGILALIFLRKRIWNNHPLEETFLFYMTSPQVINNSPLVRDFHIYFEQMKQNSYGKLSDDYQDIVDQAKQLEIKGKLVYTKGNNPKNRYGDIKPYKHNRVKLLDRDDYINASRLCVKHWGANIENQCICTDIYIATQNPISENKESKVSTIGDFWRMIIENNVCVIVNLTKCDENGKEECGQYWPEIFHGKIRNRSGNGFVDVVLLDARENNIFTERQFKVSMNNREKLVKQLHMTSWLDHSCPKTEDFLQFYSCYKRAKVQSEAVVVHCSAGVGRTGTFILIDEELSRIKTASDKIEISNNLLNLRKCRCQMVQTESQYSFIHAVIYEYLCKRGLITNPERKLIEHPQAKKYKQSYDNPIFN